MKTGQLKNYLEAKDFQGVNRDVLNPGGRFRQLKRFKFARKS